MLNFLLCLLSRLPKKVNGRRCQGKMVKTWFCFWKWFYPIWTHKLVKTEASPGISQTSKMESFTTVVSGWKLKTVIVKLSILDACGTTKNNKKRSFPLRISWVNVTKSAEKCGFGHIYWRILYWKTSFLVELPKNLINLQNFKSYDWSYELDVLNWN